MISEIMKKVKEKKQQKIEEQSTPKIKIGMSVCVTRYDAARNMQVGVIGCVVGRLNSTDIYEEPTCSYLVKFEDGSVDCFDSDAIYVDYDKELLK